MTAMTVIIVSPAAFMPALPVIVSAPFAVLIVREGKARSLASILPMHIRDVGAAAHCAEC